MMKNIVAILTIAMFSIACSQKKEEWKLVWQDDFDQIDTTVWSKIPRGTADWNNFMSDYDSLYEVKNGELILRAIKNDTQKNDTASYLTGGVYSKDKKGFANGRVEIRAKFESAQGFWPAIWMMPQTQTKWPMGGEIDIMEHLNFDSIVYQTIHTNYTLNHNLKANPKSGVTFKIDPSQYNVYAVELGQDTVKMFVNSIQTNAYPRIETQIEGQFPFADSPWYLKIDAQIGGGWVGAINDSQLPVSMTIDWVKFFQKTEQ